MVAEKNLLQQWFPTLKMFINNKFYFNKQRIVYTMKQESILNRPQVKYDKILAKEELQILGYDHITEYDYEYVYAPNDDTFLLLSALKQEIKSFQHDLIVCEIGSGTGVISANFNKWLKQQQKQPLIHLSIDINMDASLLSQKYFNKYQLKIQQINTSIFNNLVFNQKGATIRPDLIIFNPPYVPVEQEELDSQKKYLVEKLKYVRQNRECCRKEEHNLIAYSYMGGLDGLWVTRKVIKAIKWSSTLLFIVMGGEGVASLRREMEQGLSFNDELQWQWNLQCLHYIELQLQNLYVLKLSLIALEKP